MYCADLKAILAEPVNSSESDWIASKVALQNPGQIYYIGVRNSDDGYGVPGKWTLVSSGKVAPFQDWGPNNPKYYVTTECVTLKQQGWGIPKWYDEICTVRRYYICEKSTNCRSPFDLRLNSTCYFYSTTATFFDAAKKACESLGAILAEPVTREEGYLLASNAPGASYPTYKSYFIGVRYTGPTPRIGSWILESSGEEAPYTNWSPDSPLYAAGAKCVSVRLLGNFDWRGVKWYDGPCTIVSKFICQKFTVADECYKNDMCLNGGTCTDTAVLPPRCVCPFGAVGRRCETDVQNQCQSNPCYNFPGTYCTDRVFDYHCVCTSGYTGKNCETNIDECASKPCLNGGTCNDYKARYTCACTANWHGTRCEDYNACHPEVCRNGGTCTDRKDSDPTQYLCRCQIGYGGDNCEEDTADQCITGQCRNESSTCTDLHFDYRCSCSPGWTGKYCEQEINECESAPCRNGAACINGNNRYDCRCTAGWNGTQCDVGVVDTENQCLTRPCKNWAKCYDRMFSFRCECAPGFTGHTCETGINECDSAPCQNGGTCADVLNGFTCSCAAEWHGTNCEDFNSCVLSSCDNGGTCTDLPNGDRDKYFCKCPSGVSGTNCETDLINQCASNPCKRESTCSDWAFGYSCVCVSGWTGDTCNSDLNECASTPCENRGQCADEFNKYTCTCHTGWKGDTCEEVDECASLPCQNNGGCSDSLGSFSCACLSEYAGDLCQYKLPSGLTTDCPVFVSVNENVSCDCILTEPGDPPALLGWRSGPWKIENAQVTDNGREYVCEYIWAAAGVPKKADSLVYKLLIAYGPKNVVITASPPGRFVTDGGQVLTLQCQGDVSPGALYTWSLKDKVGGGWPVWCRGGNNQPTCIRKLDPVSDNEQTVICRMHNVVILENSGIAEFNISFNWSGVAHVLLFEVDGRPGEELVDVENDSMPLSLRCLVAGNPAPLVEVFRITSASSGGEEREDRQYPQNSWVIREFKRISLYTIISPSECQATDTYRCDATNKKGEHKAYLKVRTLCMPLPPAGKTKQTIVALSVLGGVGALGGLGACLFFLRKRQHQQNSEK